MMPRNGVCKDESLCPCHDTAYGGLHGFAKLALQLGLEDCDKSCDLWVRFPRCPVAFIIGQDITHRASLHIVYVQTSHV